MAILAISRDWGVNPSIVRISTDDTLATITAPLYLMTQEANIQDINAGDFQWNDNDAILITYEGGSNSLFQRNPVTQQLYAMPTVDGNQTRFNLQLSTPQTILASDNNVLQFDTVIFNKSNEFDVTDYSFKVKQNGYYSFHAQSLVSSPINLTTGAIDIGFIKNGSDIVGLNGSPLLVEAVPGLYLMLVSITSFLQLSKDDSITCNIINFSDVDITTYLPLPVLNTFTGFSVPL